jgi:transposase
LEKYNLTSFKLYEEILKKGYEGKYGMVNKFVNKIKKKLRKQAYIRFETLPGEQAQVDWGYMGELYDHNLKRQVKIYCFVIVLGYSRTVYVDFFTDMKTRNFLIGHNNAFKYFGGYTKEILYDNLKSVVIKRKGNVLLFGCQTCK